MTTEKKLLEILRALVNDPALPASRNPAQRERSLRTLADED